MTLVFGIIFGAIGSGYLVYGRRQTSTSFLICGFLLAIAPYFFDSAIWILLSGVIIAAAPFVVERYG